jgi:hypothetical protein
MSALVPAPKKKVKNPEREELRRAGEKGTIRRGRKLWWVAFARRTEKAVNGGKCAGAE